MASISTFTSEIISSSSITLFWDGTYSSITLEKSLNDSTYTTVTSGYTSSSYTFTNLNSNTVYYFRITPYDSAGDSGTSESLFVITPFVTAINSFGSGVATTTSIPLSWTGTYYKVMIYYKRCVDTTYEYLTTVTGAASYNVTSLTSDTSYNFYITPYNLNNESSTSSSIITAYTDYSPIITSINLGNATSSTFDLSWNGEFSFVKVQKSTDGGSHYTTDTNLLVYDPSNTSYSSSGSYTVTDLSPYTTYYFRLIPYTSNYNAGTTSSVVYGTTLMGITSFSYTSIGVNSVTFYWSGIYTKVSIKKTYNSNVYTAAIITNSASDTTATTSQSYTLTGLNSYTSYQFYLLPYNGTTSTTASSTLSITTDFSAQVNAIVDTNNITYYYIPIIFDTSGATSPYYSAALIEISTDGSTYYDVSLITQATSSASKYTYYVKTFGSETSGDALDGNTTYYLRTTPLSMYNVSGTVVNLTATTEGYVSAAEIYINDSGYITMDICGTYDYVNIYYGTDASFNTYSTLTISAETYVFTADMASPYSANYFKLLPYNTADYSGNYYTTLYNPYISYFYLSDIESGSNTLTFNGNYTKVLIQSATRPSENESVGEYSDLSFITTSGLTSVTFSYTQNTCIYYRITPYYTGAISGQDLSGETADAIYTPYISNLDLYVNSRYDLCLNWTGIYDRAQIQYTTYGSSTYTDLCSNYLSDLSGTNEFYVSSGSSSIGGVTFDLSGNSYQFRIIPYSIADSSNTMGIAQTTYNASISYLCPSANSVVASDINTVVLYYTGTFSQANVYFRQSGSSYSSDYIEITDSGSSYVSITSLYTNTSYYFKIIPYNSDSTASAGWPTDEVNITTQSMTTYIDLSYDSTNSSSTSVYFTWVNANYDYITIYNSTGSLVGTFYSSDSNYYDSTSIETLSPNTTYTYTVYLYDSIGSSELTTVTTYTLSSSTRDINLSYTNYVSGVTFSWEPKGYSALSVRNISTTTAEAAAAPVLGYYDSFDNEDSSNFLPNTEYTYEFSTTSDQGLVSTETKTITTMGELGFSVLYTAIDSICINVYGTYSGFAVYAGETPDTMEIIATKSGVFAPSKLPLSMLYYYPLNVDLYDYSDGVGKTADSNYVAAAANGARITTDDTIVGIGSLALSSREMQYISLPPVSNSGASEMTLSCWFKSNSSGVGAKLFDFGSSSGGGYRRWYMCMNELLENGNTTIYYCYEDDNENINTTQLVIPTNYNNGEWTHIAIVMDSAAQTWNVYINSSLIATQTGALFPVLQENYYNYIGKSFVASDEYFNGAVEDFRIYSKTLSQAEIHNIYNMSSYKFVFKVPRENTTYYIKLAPQNGAGEYGEPTSAQIVTMAASM